MNETKNNIIRQCACLKPFSAITDKGDTYELDNIIIYSEDGALIETGRGWFDTNFNYTNNDKIDGFNVGPSIKRKIKANFNCKENFIIKSEKSPYKYETLYTLYLYYKNIDYKYNGLTLDNFFLNINFSILNDKIISYIVIGDRYKKSDSIKYSKEIEETLKQLDSYHFSCEPEKFIKALETIKKYHKEYMKEKEHEKTLTADNWSETIRELGKKYFENNEKLKN